MSQAVLLPQNRAAKDQTGWQFRRKTVAWSTRIAFAFRHTSKNISKQSFALWGMTTKQECYENQIRIY